MLTPEEEKREAEWMGEFERALMRDDARERVREASWTGTENDRREQGICLPPTRPPNHSKRFKVPAGTPCCVSKVTPLKWKPYRTTHDCEFDKYERTTDKGVIFRDRGYFLHVAWRFVEQRDIRGPLKRPEEEAAQSRTTGS